MHFPAGWRRRRPEPPFPTISKSLVGSTGHCRLSPFDQLQFAPPERAAKHHQCQFTVAPGFSPASKSCATVCRVLRLFPFASGAALKGGATSSTPIHEPLARV